MRNIFSPKKSSSPRKTSTSPDNIDTPEALPPYSRHPSLSSDPVSPLRSPPPAHDAPKPLPRKPSVDPSSPAPASPREREQSSKARTSRTFGRHSTDPGSSSRRKKPEADTHPLNLPPHEYKRLSALSNMSNRSSFDKMDVDKETPSSPPASASASAPAPAPVPAPGPQASFSVPVPASTNGTKEKPKTPQIDTNGAGPVPPPHKSNPSSPVPTTEDEAESYKAAGNKFFKERDYRNAIIQYTKGMLSPSCLLPMLGYADSIYSD